MSPTSIHLTWRQKRILLVEFEKAIIVVESTIIGEMHCLGRYDEDYSNFFAFNNCSCSHSHWKCCGTIYNELRRMG